MSERAGASIIGPGASVHLNWNLPITDADLDAINRGDKKLFVWGGADYRDAFKDIRYFHFRMTNGPGIVQQVGQGWALNPHKSGYDASEHK